MHWFVHSFESTVESLRQRRRQLAPFRCWQVVETGSFVAPGAFDQNEVWGCASCSAIRTAKGCADGARNDFNLSVVDGRQPEFEVVARPVLMT